VGVYWSSNETKYLLRWKFFALWRLPELWTLSWFVSTVGGVPLEVVRGDGESQKRVV
jgi:REP element-mobilizing transposase RayT